MGNKYACYLIVQNADLGKEIVALGQTCFTVQTRMQEIRQMDEYNRLSSELAANIFRATQTEEKLRRENIKGKQKANQTHYEVGKKVRKTIQDLGGEMPENYYRDGGFQLDDNGTEVLILEREMRND